MWTTGTTHVIARLTGSTLFANHNLVSIFANDHRSLTTTTDNTEKNWNVISKMRDLRARNPYALFMKDNYGEISAKYPNLKLVDISKKAAEIWKSLPDDKKQTYIKKSEDQKTAYEQEKQRLSSNDLQVVAADEKARRIESRVKKSIQQLPSKRPRSAYAHFLSTLTRGEADLKDFMKGAAQRWSQLSTNDKQKFEELHQEEKQKYVKALVEWASMNEDKLVPRRSASPKDTPAKKTRGTTATRKTRAKSVVAKSTKTKSSKSTSDKDTSSSSDDETPSRKKSPTRTKKT